MSSERMEWVEIVEPKTKEVMYANLTTGECVWDPPEGVNIKRTDASQWWELFDQNTCRFYYYNVASQKTVWHRPQNCDIIPLAKLQTLKQNTDPGDRKEAAQGSHTKLGTMGKSASCSHHRSSAGNIDSHHRSSSSGHSRLPPDKRNSDLLASPQSRHSLHHRLPTSEDAAHKFCRHSQGSRGEIGATGTATRSSQKYGDTGKSSDSSMSSIQGYRRLKEGGGSLRIGSSQQSKRQGVENSYRNMIQESSSSHNIPHAALPHQMISYSISNSSDLNAGNLSSPSHSVNTPQFKKKSINENPKSSKEGLVSKHESFDYSRNAAGISLTRSGSFLSAAGITSSGPSPSRQYYDPGNNGGSDDSMHEKYFKSVENTPISRRRHTTTSKPATGVKHSSDSSPQTPTSPQQQQQQMKTQRPSQLAVDVSPINYNKSSHKSSESELYNLDITTKPEKYLDKMKIDRGKVSPGTISNNSMNPSSKSSSSHLDNLKSNKDNFQLNLNKPNLERHNKEMQQQQPPQTLDKKSTSSSHKHSKKKSSNQNLGGTAGFDFDYDNGNTSPLYCNWDKEMQEHLLPLQHYILEQAKLSGFGFGDFNDSDVQSDSQSEPSLSGHEPDNEDSDHSDGHGDYLSHDPYEEYGAYHRDDGGNSYYNFGHFIRENKDKDDVSETVTATLESMQDQIYSPVKNHPPPIMSQFKPFRPVPMPVPSDQIDNRIKMDPTADKPKERKIFPESFLSHSPGSGKIGEMALLKECDIEKFAEDNLNLHSKGIFRKKSSIRDMLSWTANAISRPMLSLARDKMDKKVAIELFKLVQIYMGDRKARIGMTLNSVCIDIIAMAIGQTQLRDELYIQLCRQTTENPSRDSLMRGWELMAICLAFLPPSPTFQPALLGYINRHRDPTFATSFKEVGKWPIHVQISHYATVACKRLDRIGSAGKKQAKKPTEDEINQAREQIFRESMFGNTLDEVMELQKDRFPDLKLPWIQTTLSQQVLLLTGKQTEGIFRVPADVDEVNALKTRLDKWDFPENKGTMDAHTPASLLKLWYRELYDPLIPDELYEECVATEDPKEVAAIVEKLPKINQLVLRYLVHFLQQFSQPDVVAQTKMDSSNLAMVFAPNLLRCLSTDPKVILENARKEMAFMRTLIINMDTTSIASLV